MSTQQPLGSMSVLHPNLDLGRPLQAVKEAGAAFLPHALSEPFREELQREIQDGPFERLPDQIGPVRQEADLFVITDAMTAYPTLTRLRAAFVTRLRQHSRSSRGLLAGGPMKPTCSAMNRAPWVSPPIWTANGSPRWSPSSPPRAAQGSPSARPEPARSSKNGKPAPAASPSCADRAC